MWSWHTDERKTRQLTCAVCHGRAAVASAPRPGERLTKRTCRDFNLTENLCFSYNPKDGVRGWLSTPVPPRTRCRCRTANTPPVPPDLDCWDSVSDPKTRRGGKANRKSQTADPVNSVSCFLFLRYILTNAARLEASLKVEMVLEKRKRGV